LKLGNTYAAMIRENRRLITDEPVEVQDCKKITNHFRRSHKPYHNLIKKNWKMPTCNQLVGLANTRASTDYAQESPQSP
jgi:hypothetical protein